MIIQDEVNDGPLNSQNITSRRGATVNTSQLDNTLIFTTDTSGIAKTGSSTPSASPERKPNEASRPDQDNKVDQGTIDIEDQGDLKPAARTSTKRIWSAS